MVKLAKKNEVVLSYKDLGNFVRFRRQSLGYKSIDQFAEATGIDRTYIVRLENGKQFGSPENFVLVARALEVTPGFMMDIFAGGVGFDEGQSLPGPSIILPESFTIQDKRALEEYIAFLEFKKNRSIIEELTSSVVGNNQLPHPLSESDTAKIRSLTQLLKHEKQNKATQQQNEANSDNTGSPDNLE